MGTFKKILPICLKKLHSDIKISEDFLPRIHDEKNSWSFITKFAQFIEGFFTQILVQRLNEEASYNTISNLPQSARLNLAFDLNLVTKEQKLLFLTIAEIRNDFIHNISNVELCLSDYLKTLKVNRIKEIYKRFKAFPLDEKITSHEEFIDDCVSCIFTICCSQIVKVNDKIDEYADNRKRAEFRAKHAERLLPKFADEDNLSQIEMVHDYVSQAIKVLKNAGLLKFTGPK
jgi:hypothetical protein